MAAEKYSSVAVYANRSVRMQGKSKVTRRKTAVKVR